MSLTEAFMDAETLLSPAAEGLGNSIWFPAAKSLVERFERAPFNRRARELQSALIVRIKSGGPARYRTLMLGVAA